MSRDYKTAAVGAAASFAFTYAALETGEPEYAVPAAITAAGTFGALAGGEIEELEKELES